MVGRTEATRAVDARLRNKFHFFAPRRRRYLAAPGDVLHAPLLNVDPDGTSVREPLRPGLDLVNAVCVDLHTARSSASASRRIALGSSARHVQYLRSTLGPDIDPHGHGTRSSDALGVRYPRNNSTERRSMSQSSRGDMEQLRLHRCFGAVVRVVFVLIL